MSADMMTEVDLDALIDLSATVPCMWPHDTCQDPATYKMTNLCTARHGYTLCTAHTRIEQEEDARRLADPFRGCICDACKQSLPRPFCEWSQL